MKDNNLKRVIDRFFEKTTKKELLDLLKGREKYQSIKDSGWIEKDSNP